MLTHGHARRRSPGSHRGTHTHTHEPKHSDCLQRQSFNAPGLAWSAKMVWQTCFDSIHFMVWGGGLGQPKGRAAGCKDACMYGTEVGACEAVGAEQSMLHACSAVMHENRIQVHAVRGQTVCKGIQRHDDRQAACACLAERVCGCACVGVCKEKNGSRERRGGDEARRMGPAQCCVK